MYIIRIINIIYVCIYNTYIYILIYTGKKKICQILTVAISKRLNYV